MPDARAGEPIHLPNAELRGGASRVGDLFCRALADALRITVPPDVGRQGRLMPLVNWVAHRLPDEVGRDRVALESVPVQDLPP